MAWITSKRADFMVNVVIHAGIMRNRKVINILGSKLLIKQKQKTEEII